MSKTGGFKVDINSYHGTKLHVVDVSAIMMASHKNFKMPNLSYNVDGVNTPTKALYGLMKLFISCPITDDFIFCFDTKGNSRKKEDSDYKANREIQSDDYYMQASIAREILSNSGFSLFSEVGYEADDLVVHSVNSMKDKYDNIFIHTNDYDLTQSVCSNVILKNCVTRYSDVTRDNFEAIMGIPYNTVSLYKSTVGDTSDNIKGIKGFGDKAFSSLIEQVSIIYDLTKIRENNLEHEIISNFSSFSEEKKQQALSSLNLVLPRLPDVEVVINSNINKNNFIDYMIKYGMNSVVKAVKSLG